MPDPRITTVRRCTTYNLHNEQCANSPHGPELEHRYLTPSRRELELQLAAANDTILQLRDELIRKEVERHKAAVGLIEAEFHRDLYKHYVELLCNSMHPHPTEHPTMYTVQQAALKLLADGPPPLDALPAAPSKVSRGE